MTSIGVTVDIDATPAEVWATLEPIESHVDWMADAESIRFISAATRGNGTMFECVTKVGPITITDKMTITEWEPERRMGVRHTGVVTGVGAFELTPIDLDRRTRFSWVEDLNFPWFLGGRLGEAIGGKFVMQRIWRGNLNRLKQLVEAASAVPADR